MSLTDHAFEPDRVRLWGDREVIEVTSPMPGVARVRHAPESAVTSFTHPRLREKRSWAVLGSTLEPLDAKKSAATFTVKGAGFQLEVGRGWIFREERGGDIARCIEVRGEVRPGFPIDVFKSRIALASPEDEAYLGFGEKVGPLDKRGMKLVFWNTDNFPPTPGTDPLYASIPFFMGLRQGKAWGFFLDETWRSEVDVAASDPSRIVWESSGPELDVYLIAGPGPEDVLRRYVALTGRPPLPPLWSLGFHQSRWGYENARELRDLVAGFRQRQLPLDAVHLDIDHMDAYKALTWDRSRFGEREALAKELDVKLVPIVDPALKVQEGYPLYEEALSKDYLVRLERGIPLIGEVWPDPAVFPDFTRDEVIAWWAEKIPPVDGVWNDMNEPACFSIRESRGVPAPGGARLSGTGTVEGSTLPYEARHGDRRHIEVHNAYASGMARATFEGLSRQGKRPFVLTRAGYAGIQRWAAMWTGDFESHFTHLEAQIPLLLGMGLSGLAFTGADIPGFLGRATGELMTRWMQLGVFFPLMRAHSAKGTPRKEPWSFGEPWLSFAYGALERRYRLLPTLYSLFHEARESGLPILRPLFFLHPADKHALAAWDQFLFGPDLLVAPVVRASQTRRMAYLPRGEWLELFNLGEPGQRVSGGRHVVVEAPLDTTPIWLRAGGALALTEPAEKTSSASWTSLTWHIHAADRVAARLYEDAGDGDGPSRVTEIRGERSGGKLRLERRMNGHLPLARKKERIVLYGEIRADLEVDADWSEIAI